MPFDPSTAASTPNQPFDPTTARPSFDDALSATPIVETKGMPSRFDVLVGQVRQATYAPKVEPASNSSFPASFKADLVRDPQTKLKLVADSVFPGDPNGINKVGIIGGRPVKVNDQGQLEYVSGKGTEFAANLAANVPEMLGATVGAFAGSPLIGSTLGVAGARGLKDAAAGLMFNEPQTIGGNLKDIGVQAGTNLIVGTVAKGLTGAVNRGRVVDFSPSNLVEAQATQAAVKSKFGIDLNLAQASQDPRLIQMWKYVARYPGKSAEIVDLADTLQRGQTDAAVQKLLDMTAQGYPSEILGQTAIDVSRTTIANTRKAISDQVNPLYEQAYAAVPEVTSATKQGAAILDYLKLPYFQKAFSAGQQLRALETKSVGPRQQTIESLLNRDAEAGTFNKATTIIDSTPTTARRITSRLESGLTKNTSEGVLTQRAITTHVDISKPSLAELDYTKRALDIQIEELKAARQFTRAKFLSDRRREFVSALDALPNSEWQTARAAYGDLAQRELVPLENGVVGILAKLKDPKAATAAAKIFTDPNVTPRAILQAKGAILHQEGGQEAWDGLVRQYLAKAWNSANKVAQSGESINPTGKFAQSVAGTPTDVLKLRAMLGDERGQLAMDLIDVFRKVGSTTVGGSDTAFNQEIRRGFSSGTAQAVRMVGAPRQTALEAADIAAVRGSTERIAQALTDPAKVRQLRAVVKMPDSVRRTALLTAILGVDLAKPAAASAVRGVDQIPPSYTPPLQ